MFINTVNSLAPRAPKRLGRKATDTAKEQSFEAEVELVLSSEALQSLSPEQDHHRRKEHTPDDPRAEDETKGKKGLDITA